MAQEYEIDIKRFNGQDYDTLFPTPATHATTHQADGSDPVVMQSGNYGALSIPSSAYQNNSITRQKLAQDALYSPIQDITTTPVAISTAHIGKTLVAAYTTPAKDYVFTLDAATAFALPQGFEVAFLWRDASSVTIEFADTVKVGIVGETTWKTNFKVALSERFTMVALKKTHNDSTNSYWVLTGNVEVVS